ncbi:hypothetical protein HDV00_003168 [Rhizophlyctis rosea]|nr:hypothetical protein HDV00_003168 [Rhizophlyctis rosea]
MFATPWKEESYPLSGDPAPESFPENGVRFVAYNFYQRPPPVQSFPATDHKEDRLRDFINGVEDSGSFLDKFDIYAFSEMFGAYNSRRDRLVSAAKEHGLLYAAHGPERNWWKGRIVDSGLLVLSRYPIASVKRLQYEGGTDSDRAAAKGILYAQILLSPKARLHLFLSHLQSSYVPDDEDDGDNLDEKGTVIRHSEFHVFRKFILRTLRQASRDGSNYTDDAVVLAGDFNVNGARFGWQPKVDGLEYLRMMRIFRGQDEDGEDDDDVKNVVIDVLHASAGEHPETWGQWEACLKGNSVADSVRHQNVDTVGQKAEAVGEPLYGVNAESPIGKRLDYVLDWRLRREGTLRSDVNATRALKFVVTETRVERFEVLNRPYSRLSGDEVHTARIFTKPLNSGETMIRLDSKEYLEKGAPTV